MEKDGRAVKNGTPICDFNLQEEMLLSCAEQESNQRSRLGERGERCRWQEERPERVALVVVYLPLASIAIYDSLRGAPRSKKSRIVRYEDFFGHRNRRYNKAYIDFKPPVNQGMLAPGKHGY